jgi:hypothetical protein
MPGRCAPQTLRGGLNRTFGSAAAAPPVTKLRQGIRVGSGRVSGQSSMDDYQALCSPVRRFRRLSFCSSAPCPSRDSNELTALSIEATSSKAAGNGRTALMSAIASRAPEP